MFLERRGSPAWRDANGRVPITRAKSANDRRRPGYRPRFAEAVAAGSCHASEGPRRHPAAAWPRRSGEPRWRRSRACPGSTSSCTPPEAGMPCHNRAGAAARADSKACRLAFRPMPRPTSPAPTTALPSRRAARERRAAAGGGEWGGAATSRQACHTGSSEGSLPRGPRQHVLMRQAPERWPRMPAGAVPKSARAGRSTTNRERVCRTAPWNPLYNEKARLILLPFEPANRRSGWKRSIGEML